MLTLLPPRSPSPARAASAGFSVPCVSSATMQGPFVAAVPLIWAVSVQGPFVVVVTVAWMESVQGPFFAVVSVS